MGVVSYASPRRHYSEVESGRRPSMRVFAHSNQKVYDKGNRNLAPGRESASLFSADSRDACLHGELRHPQDGALNPN